MGAATLRISSFPGQSQNPYLDLFYGALAPHGVERVEAFRLSPRWLLARRKEVDVLHFHWPEWLWDGSSEPSARAFVKLQIVLVMAGILGIKRVWTVHNLEVHEGKDGSDRVGQRLLARWCDLLIVHSAHTAEQVRARLHPRGPVVVMPHGNYEGHYPEPRPRAVALAGLGLEEGNPLVCCVGWLRDYKGLDIACDAAARLGESVRLVIAGPPHRSFDLDTLTRRVAKSPNVHLIPRLLDDQELVDLISVSEAVVLPYRQITGSGALLAAWTQGRGVVASDLDFFREALPVDSEAGILFETGRADALAQALSTYLAIPHEARCRAARERAEDFAWERCVLPVAAVLESWR